jgi:hypothetical protein
MTETEFESAHHGSGVSGQIRAQRAEEYEKLFENSAGAISEKLTDFTKFVPRESLARFLVKQEIFKRILHVQGSVVECGVYKGSGLLALAQLSELLEPLNHQRKIIGFDSFSGFPKVSEQDKSKEKTSLIRPGTFTSSQTDLEPCIELFESTRFLKHVPKIVLVPGDMCQTIPQFVEQNPQLVVSMLYLDADLYEPTKVAIECFLPRMPKGAVIAFDELNDSYWPGETLAVLEQIGIRKLKIERLYATSISFAELD